MTRCVNIGNTAGNTLDDCAVALDADSAHAGPVQYNERLNRLLKFCTATPPEQAMRQHKRAVLRRAGAARTVVYSLAKERGVSKSPTA